MSDYLTLKQLVQQIPEPDAGRCLNLLKENLDKINKAPGSSFNHQSWEGGYVDHITEVMNIACRLYHLMNSLRPLPFSLADALLILFLHDIEKPWKYAGVEMSTKGERAEFRNRLIHLSGFQLTDQQSNALKYVEGEHNDYSNKYRTMNELAALCNMCDVASARIWHDQGQEKAWG